MLIDLFLKNFVGVTKFHFVIIWLLILTHSYFSSNEDKFLRYTMNTYREEYSAQDMLEVMRA